jgi:hypothetical protein
MTLSACAPGWLLEKGWSMCVVVVGGGGEGGRDGGGGRGANAASTGALQHMSVCVRRS